MLLCSDLPCCKHLKVSLTVFYIGLYQCGRSLCAEGVSFVICLYLSREDMSVHTWEGQSFVFAVIHVLKFTMKHYLMIKGRETHICFLVCTVLA